MKKLASEWKAATEFIFQSNGVQGAGNKKKTLKWPNVMAECNVVQVFPLEKYMSMQGVLVHVSRYEKYHK